MQEQTQQATIPQSPLETRIAAVADLSPDQVNLWRHHPVSKVFLQWVSDYADQLERASMAQWLSGGSLEGMGERRGRILACRETATAGIDAIRKFYGVSGQ